MMKSLTLLSLSGLLLLVPACCGPCRKGSCPATPPVVTESVTVTEAQPAEVVTTEEAAPMTEQPSRPAVSNKESLDAEDEFDTGS